MASIPTSTFHRPEAAPMLHEPTEIHGSRTRIRYQAKLLYDVFVPTDFIFSVHAAETPQQRVLAESVTLDPDVPLVAGGEPAAGNRLLRTRCDGGPFTIGYSAHVEVNHYMEEPSRIVAGRHTPPAPAPRGAPA